MTLLFTNKYGKSLVSDDFNQMCVDSHVEATIQVYPNPGGVEQMRLITFRNFNLITVNIVRSNGKTEYLPGKGTLQVLIHPNEELPKLERTD